MSYDVEDLAKQILAARKNKGFSQRQLSSLAGLPQPHISKIESGSVDLRISSLTAIARALELEFVLVPRKALPAVKSIAKDAAKAESFRPGVNREFNRLAAILKATGGAVEMSARPHLRRVASCLASVVDPGMLRDARRAFERAKKSGSQNAAEKAVEQLSALASLLARTTPGKEHIEAPRPAYSLEEDDD